VWRAAARDWHPCAIAICANGLWQLSTAAAAAALLAVVTPPSLVIN